MQCLNDSINLWFKILIYYVIEDRGNTNLIVDGLSITENFFAKLPVLGWKYSIVSISYSHRKLTDGHAFDFLTNVEEVTQMRNFKEENKKIIICSLYFSISFYSLPNTPISLTFVSFHQIFFHPVCFPPVGTHYTSSY